MDFKHTIDANDNGQDYEKFGKEMEDYIKKTLANPKENLGAS
jgi:hypothetical protein